MGPCIFAKKLMIWVALCICYLVSALLSAHLTIISIKVWGYYLRNVRVYKVSFTESISWTFTAHICCDKCDNYCNFLNAYQTRIDLNELGWSESRKMNTIFEVEISFNLTFIRSWVRKVCRALANSEGKIYRRNWIESVLFLKLIIIRLANVSWNDIEDPYYLL